MGNIFFIDMNVRGAWVVYGRIGVRQYYGYTKEEAKNKYKKECEQTLLDEVKK